MRHSDTSFRHSHIPSYAMYGDNAPAGWSNMFNFERIPERSSLYDWSISPHVHTSFIQILCMTKGHGETLQRDSMWSLKAPALVLVPAGHVHGFEFNPSVDGMVVTAEQKPLESMAGILMPELMNTLRQPLALNLSEDCGRYQDGLFSIFGTIEREWRTPSPGQVAAGLSLLTALVVQVARIATTLNPSERIVSSRKARQLEKFHSLIDENFRERLTVQRYAELLGITPGQLTRITRESLGRSSLDLINERVLHEAQRELIYTFSSVKQIAANMGFEDEGYFGRFFRKQTGMSPQAYRQRELERLGQAE